MKESNILLYETDDGKINVDVTDKLMVFRNKKVLNNSGKISYKKAIEKAENEYEKFRKKQHLYKQII